ncbi:cell wall integrity and stress response component 1-like [Syzygium oleosum]|uniref:cell wall integrity and stress response component 1-like n=1 Tax=Syzygium oleosum TaxID=219896 RepID=UPI0011D2C5BB|nr:cell wall integrity and stress response component 1-like [Syzygium oleosum]XP_056167119.1 cell wall integrity and stress response component 1-like [Syzygium oleosum]
MMMARSLSPSSSSSSPTLAFSMKASSSSSSSSSRLLAHRPHSSSSSSSSSSPADVGGDPSDPLLRKLEDVIHHLIVRRSEPDWLPFRPGSSYWVPPRSKSRGIAQLIGKLASSHSSHSHPHPLADPFLSSSSAASAAGPHGWPSSSFFIHGALPSAYPEEAAQTSDTESQSEDEEG